MRRVFQLCFFIHSFILAFYLLFSMFLFFLKFQACSSFFRIQKVKMHTFILNVKAFLLNLKYTFIKYFKKCNAKRGGASNGRRGNRCDRHYFNAHYSCLKSLTCRLMRQGNRIWCLAKAQTRWASSANDAQSSFRRRHLERG